MLLFSWYPAVMLALEAINVINLRVRKMGRGGQEAAAEGDLMISEKLKAFFEAGTVLIEGGGDPAAVIDMYRRHVAANAVRLAGGER